MIKKPSPLGKSHSVATFGRPTTIYSETTLLSEMSNTKQTLSSRFGAGKTSITELGSIWPTRCLYSVW